jgi:hypothetical protein
MDCVYKYNFNISAFVGLLYEHENPFCFYIQRYNRTVRSLQPLRGGQNIPLKSRYLSTKLDMIRI